MIEDEKQAKTIIKTLVITVFVLLVLLVSLFKMSHALKSQLDLTQGQIYKVNAERIKLRDFLDHHGYKVQGGYDEPVTIEKYGHEEF